MFQKLFIQNKFKSTLPLSQKKDQMKQSKTYFISDGVRYRNSKMHHRALSKKDKRYLSKITRWSDSSWKFFTKIESDFRVLYKPISTS